MPQTSNATILKVLDLSTSHLPEDVCQELNGYDGVVAHETRYGWLMWANPEPDGDNDVPKEVLRIYRYAREHDCAYVLFDRDGDINPDLPTWDW